MDFQKYNIKEKKQKEKGKREIKGKKKKGTRIIKKKKKPTTIQRLYMVFALKKKKVFLKNKQKNIVIIGYRNKN